MGGCHRPRACLLRCCAIEDTIKKKELGEEERGKKGWLTRTQDQIRAGEVAARARKAGNSAKLAE